MEEANNCLSKIAHQLVQLFLVGKTPNSALEMPKREEKSSGTYMPISFYKALYFSSSLLVLPVVLSAPTPSYSLAQGAFISSACSKYYFTHISIPTS